MKIIQLVILTFWILIIPVKAQELGYINDPDGYTNLRNHPSGKSDIIGVIIKGQEFNYYPDINSDWWKVEFGFRNGFIHKSRIKNFNDVKAKISSFFNEFYSSDRNNVELGEGNNEKLFMLTQEYPLATMISFSEQKKEVQDFLIFEYKSPIHDLIKFQLIYSQLITEKSIYPESEKIAEVIKIAAGDMGLELKQDKTFIEDIPEYNRTDKNEASSNRWFVSSINGKSITFYLNHPQIDTYSKMFYQGQFGLLDDGLTFSILDSVLTNNPDTRPFYIHVFNSALRIADGALAESIGTECLQYMKKFPCEFMALKSNPIYSDNFDKWIDLAAFEYYYDNNPVDEITKTYNLLKETCNMDSTEVDYVKNRLIKNIEDE